YVDARAGDQLLHLALALPAEGAQQLVVAIARSRHDTSSPGPRSSCTAISPVSPALDLAMLDNGVDDAVLLGLFGGHEVVALHVARHLLQLLSGVLGHDLFHLAFEGDRLAGVDLDVGRLP